MSSCARVTGTLNLIGQSHSSVMIHAYESSTNKLIGSTDLYVSAPLGPNNGT